MNSRERCLAAIHGQVPDRTPVFPLLMFFAQKRAGITYREFATNGRALADAQLAIRERFPVDAVTACSDAFRVVSDLGAEMFFPEDGPPFAVTPLVSRPADLDRLGKLDPADRGSRLADRLLGTRLMYDACGTDCLVVGWVDLPFAEACSLCGVGEFMLLLVDEPSFAHRILDFLTEIVIDFAVAQIRAGAAMVGAGDAAASLVAPQQYREFALPYEQRVCAAIRAAGGLAKLHICGNTTHLLEDMATCGADLFNVDHLVDFDRACRVYGERGLCFKGNLDPVAHLLRTTPEACRQLCRERIGRAQGRRYMLSPGCEVPADTPDEVFRAFCETPRADTTRSVT